MTRKISMRFLLLMAAIIFSAHQMSFAQVWNYNNFGPGDIGFTNNTSPTYNITGIGIGTFTSNISAALHVNTNLTATNSGFNAGEVFRTDGNENTDNLWQLFTGATAGSLTEKFRIAVPANSSNAVISTVQNGDMMFNTNNTQRMIIDRDPGHIGIGLNHFPANNILDILPDANFPNTGIGINNETVLHNWGVQNIFVGVGAGRNNTTGFANAFFGMDAGMNNVTGNKNTFIGAFAGASSNEVTNATALGHAALVGCHDCTVIGGKFVGINTSQPEATLEVNGSVAAKELFLITDAGKTDLVALVMQLKTEIEILKQQMITSIKN